MSILSVEHLRKSFDGEMVLQDVSFTLEQGECLTILGNSGSGKSTCLRCLNQLALPDSGAIYFEGKNTLEKGYDVNYLRSKVNMVFQSFNLFANMDVLKNCTLAQQKVLHRGAVEAEAVARRQLAKVGLQEKAHAFPASLSGGQKQRVAIARSLCMDPSILLFDEPTSALDPAMVAEVLRVMEDLRKEGVTMVLVTHQVEFARRISSKILFLHQGEVNLLGTPEEVFASSTLEFASFLALEGK